MTVPLPLKQRIALAEVFLDAAARITLDFVEPGLDGLGARANLGTVNRGRFRSDNFISSSWRRSWRRRATNSTRSRLFSSASSEMKAATSSRRVGELGQHPNVDRVGLGQPNGRLAEGASLLQINHSHRQSHGLQRAGQRRLVPTGGFYDRQSNIKQFQRHRQRRLRHAPAALVHSSCQIALPHESPSRRRR